MAGVASASATAQTRWILPAEDPAVLELARALGMHAPVARVLWNRGYRTASNARAFLNPSIDDLHDPFLLRDMDVAVARLLKAITDKQRILLYGDYDVDGTTSIVVLKKALDLAGASTEFFVPHRKVLRS
jgi:single-stranded-DNA-specific exonuclease